MYEYNQGNGSKGIVMNSGKGNEALSTLFFHICPLLYNAGHRQNVQQSFPKSLPFWHGIQSCKSSNWAEDQKRIQRGGEECSIRGRLTGERVSLSFLFDSFSKRIISSQSPFCRGKLLLQILQRKEIIIPRAEEEVCDKNWMALTLKRMGRDVFA